jgi:hypothetical protein
MRLDQQKRRGDEESDVERTIQTIKESEQRRP